MSLTSPFGATSQADDVAAQELPVEWHDLNGDQRPDLIARDSRTGVVYVYPHQGFNGSQTYGSRTAVLTGMQPLNWIYVFEVTGDFYADLIARKADGTLVVFPGTGQINGTSTFEPAVEASVGWQIVTSISIADVTGDGYGDIVARWPGGELFVYPHTGMFDGTNTWAGRELIGTGWNIMGWIGAAELTSDDEKADLIGWRTDNGTLQLYPRARWYDGSRTFVGPVQTGTGWNNVEVKTLAAVTPDTFTDIVARRPTGELVAYPNAGGYDGDNTFRSPVVIGLGWSSLDLIA